MFSCASSRLAHLLLDLLAIRALVVGDDDEAHRRLVRSDAVPAGEERFLLGLLHRCGLGDLLRGSGELLLRRLLRTGDAGPVHEQQHDGARDEQSGDRGQPSRGAAAAAAPGHLQADGESHVGHVSDRAVGAEVAADHHDHQEADRSERPQPHKPEQSGGNAPSATKERRGDTQKIREPDERHRPLQTWQRHLAPDARCGPRATAVRTAAGKGQSTEMLRDEHPAAGHADEEQHEPDREERWRERGLCRCGAGGRRLRPIL